MERKLTYATDINIIKENKGRCKEWTIRGHRIVDNAIGFPDTYPLDSDLSGGLRYLTFKPAPGAWK